MFDNIGGKLKGAAKFMCWAGAAVSLAAGVLVMTFDATFYGLLIMIGGSLYSWISSFGMYGLGQLVENTDIIAGRSTAPSEPEPEKKPVPAVPLFSNAVQPAAAAPVQTSDGGQKQPSAAAQTGCEERQDDDEFVDMYCTQCGELLSFYRRDLRQGFQTCPMCGARIETGQYRH